MNDPAQNSIFDTYYEDVNENVETVSAVVSERRGITAGTTRGSRESFAVSAGWMEDTPPPPDLFPDDWENAENTQVSGEVTKEVEIVAKGEMGSNQPESKPANGDRKDTRNIKPDTSIKPSVEVVAGQIANTPSPMVEPMTPPTILVTSEEITNTPEPVERTVSAQQYLVSPIQSGDSENIYMITVVLRATGDRTRDVLRMRRIHGTVMSFPGNDRFAFQVFERGRGYLVEFPNFTTGMCPDLISKLKLLVGSENVRIEPILFQ
jgi:hypothetical protein